MIWIKDAKYVKDFQVFLKFNDDKETVVDLESYIKSKPNNTVFEPLKVLENFQTVRFNPDTDTIEWSNGADIAPERLYELANNNQPTRRGE